MNILIVDDEKLEQMIIEKLINKEKFGIHKIYAAASFKKAQEILKAHPISIVLCDIEMPKGSGIDLVEWIRQKHLQVEIIYITGHAQFTYAKAAIRLEVVDYLLKPLEKEDLEKALSHAISKLPADNVTDLPSALSPDIIVKKAQKYMKEHYKEDINRSELAERYYIHPDYFSHIFKEQTGMSYMDYLIRLRITRASELLSQSSMSISEIATRVGYSNITHFGRHFKRETGKTPSEFRKCEK